MTNRSHTNRMQSDLGAEGRAPPTRFLTYTTHTHTTINQTHSIKAFSMLRCDLSRVGTRAQSCSVAPCKRALRNAQHACTRKLYILYAQMNSSRDVGVAGEQKAKDLRAHDAVKQTSSKLTRSKPGEGPYVLFGQWASLLCGHKPRLKCSVLLSMLSVPCNPCR